jgi:non-specific riboncleoside hydrolase
MAGLDVGWKALVFHDDSLKIKAQNKTGEMIYALFQKYRSGSLKTGLKMYDSCAIAYLLKKEMYETVYTHVSIETKGEYTSGATLVDLKGYLKKEPNVTVCMDIDANMFSDWLLQALSKCN